VQPGSKRNIFIIHKKKVGVKIEGQILGEKTAWILNQVVKEDLPLAAGVGKGRKPEM